MSFQRIASVAALALSATALAACGASSGQEDESSAAAPAKQSDEPIKIAYIQKQGDQQYFVDEAVGAREEAEKLGNVEVTFTDVGMDANAAITAVNTAVAQEVDGVAIVIPDAKVGPQVADSLRRANIPFVASDDPFADGEGKQVPWVSIDSLTMGQQVGEKAGELYAEAGWSAADTRILSVLQEDLGVCQDREKGYKETFEQAAGELPEMIRVGTDNSNPQAQDKAGAAITSNQGVKHWVVMGCNDEGVTGAVTALANAGFGAEEVVGVGLGAYLACKDWQAGKETGNKAALYVDGRIDGAASVRTLVEAIRGGTEPPAETLGKAVMVDATNWEESGVKCT